tara:strand:- start:353 stop:2245 length:1893 start_codon:yes stop_codon:yes gene_type:complete
MPLTKLQFKPGINRDITSYSNEGGWVDCDKVRFRQGYPEVIGGWEKYSSETYIGTVRGLFNWTTLDGSDLLGLGTESKYYIEKGAQFYDVTPIRATTTNGITFAATNGSSTITATDSTHGAVEGDFVTISGAVSLGGLITAAVLNQEYQIFSVPDVNTYTIIAKDTSGATVTANASDSGNGGSGVDGVYQLNSGLNTGVGGNGWGAGTWGRGTWGSGAAINVLSSLRIWTHDNFGEDLLLNPRDGAIYYWDASDGLTARAVELNTTNFVNAIEPPIFAKQVLVSDVDRHVIAFGTNPVFGIEQDPLLIRFSDQESFTDWSPTATNTAGDLRIGSGSEFITAIETKREIVVITDSSVHSMQFIGAPFTFGIQPIASNTTIMGPNAAVAVEDAVFWMGRQNFYLYDGQTKQLPCTVKERVFFDFDYDQKDKVYASVISEFTEIIWFYTSETNSLANGGTGENDRYVIFNYGENSWYYGNLGRSAFLDRGIRDFPIGAADNYLYNHELGYNDDGSAMVSTIESSTIDIADGDNFTFINRLIPDFTFNGSTTSSPTVNVTLQANNFPGQNYLQSEISQIDRTATSTTVPFEQFTNKADVRLRGRAFSIKVDCSTEGVRWRLGSPRVSIRQDGRR